MMGWYMSFRVRRLLLIFGIWTALGLVYASHLYFYHAIRDGASSWSDSLLESFADWYTWAILSVPVLTLARRYPLQTRRNWIVHICLSLVFSALQVLLHSVADQALIHHNISMQAIDGAFASFFARTYHFGLLVYWLIVVARDQQRPIHQPRAKAAPTRPLIHL